MTREEQIEQKAKELGQKYFPNEHNIWTRPNYEAQFVESACKEMIVWADEHPSEEIQRLKKMFESDPDAYEQGYKDAVKKAVEWIKRFAYNSVVTDHIGEREKQAIIMTFKEAMEEQQ